MNNTTLTLIICDSILEAERFFYTGYLGRPTWVQFVTRVAEKVSKEIEADMQRDDDFVKHLGDKS